MGKSPPLCACSFDAQLKTTIHRFLPGSRVCQCAATEVQAPLTNKGEPLDNYKMPWHPRYDAEFHTR